MTASPKIDRHDKDFVYFADGTRMAYEPGTSGMSNPLGLFPANGRKGPKMEAAHYAAATSYLTSKGIS